MENNLDHDEVQEIVEERLSLEQRLAQLQSQQKKLFRKTNKKKTQPLAKKRFRKDNKNYKQINSKIDYNLIMSHKEKMTEIRQKQKKELELAECTFQPKIDKHSKNMTLYKEKIYDKELPKKIEALSEEEEEEESFEEERVNKGPKRKYNPKFYQEKVSWKKKKTEIHNKKRMDNTLKEISRIKTVPKTNRKMNKKLVRKDKDFLKRVEQDQINSENLKKKLDKIYNKNSFKPAIHHNNDVKSQVFEHKSGLYLSLKNEKF